MTKTLVRRTAIATILASGLIAAGCGGDDDGGDDSTGASDATPEEVVTAYYQATADGDAATICDLLSAETVKQVADDGDAGSCEEATEGTLGGNQTTKVAAAMEAEEATIDGDTATVKIAPKTSADQEEEEAGEGEPAAQEAGQATVSLVKEDGEWKIDFSQ